ncbi:hydroxyproline-rich glycoprotein precursor, putative [Perkinsus marinus ATCC 50983]|uniref:Hydroxyproline-rich glycoprotein, putative n=1 Tax=Perkinsus marinus (strain ATCC 50983 / TXsc) TaxID=423536 RepID=C5KEQ2_PERM5|nr:hydroxyproline-rich glycoprotein precursor, putative [Perkinsus marinus ATCC 50983]EER17040.1 hydroxyproline-rich glycoprotein precursor, putative [Perkinsus marinus ATCC 50983]|eukprot:XP_002785244.1 hydroxyproline-rich glycoprotein precursor, putative [Perkinsus marinus ATCC 50983]
MSSPPTSPELPKYAERVAGSRPQGMEAKLAEALDNEWKRTEECREKEREICELRKRLREYERNIEQERLLGSGENEGDDVKLAKEMRSLEEQVDEWKDKEVEALTRVRELEGERDQALEEARCLEEKLQQERQKRLALERAEEELRTQCKQLEKKISVLREENSTLEDEKQMVS